MPGELVEARELVYAEAPSMPRRGRTGPAPISPILRIFQNLTEDENGCWLWGGTTSRGYGQINVGSRTTGDTSKRPVHIVVFEFFNGLVSPGHEIDHVCHNRSLCPGGETCTHRRCCNPSHLEAVTHAENMSRWPRRQPACKRGHPWDDTNTRWFVDKGGKRRRVCRACAKV